MGDRKFNREWVKTFAIIFLSIMLVLTFFSNTIMNMSLAEVSTDYVQYGTIKSQVRGSGTVVANDSFGVTYPVTREISKIAVKQGQRVNKGDVLFVLAQSESKELETARENYESLNYEYTKMLINSGADGSSGTSAMNLAQLERKLREAKTKLASVSQNKTLLENARLAVRDAEKAVTLKQNEISRLETEKSAIGYTPTEYEVLSGKTSEITYEEYASAAAEIDLAEENVNNAKNELTKAKQEYNVAKGEHDKYQREYDTTKGTTEDFETLENQMRQSERTIDDMEREIKLLRQDFHNRTSNRALEKAEQDYEKAQKKYKNAKNALSALYNDPSATEEQIEEAKDAYERAGNELDAAYEVYDSILTNEENETESFERTLAAKELEYKYALEDHTELEEKYVKAKAVSGELAEIQDKIDATKIVLNSAEAKVATAQLVYDNALAAKEIVETNLSSIRNGYKLVKVREYELLIENEKTNLEALKTTLENEKEKLSELEEEYGDGEEALKSEVESLEKQVADARNGQKITALDIEKMKKQLDKAAEEIAKMELQYTDTEILAPVSGVVESINVVTGGKTTPDTSLLDISLAEQGFKMTMSVSAEQASKLRVGVAAEITGYVPYGSTISATLASIKNDTANPASRQKILEFNVEGDIVSGQNLSIAVGDKNVSYDKTVPNTAIREDSDGKYILIVEAKNTPISTRYIAKRVPVSVVASDDTRSAVSGDLPNDYNTFVISTSSKPINDGEQVKLADE